MMSVECVLTRMHAHQMSCFARPADRTPLWSYQIMSSSFKSIPSAFHIETWLLSDPYSGHLSQAAPNTFVASSVPHPLVVAAVKKKSDCC